MGRQRPSFVYHAGKGNGTIESGYSVGIEIVGNYDNEVWSGKTKDTALGVIKILQKKLKIKDSETAFHRNFSQRSCPGWAITKKWLLQQLNFKEENMYNVKSVLKNVIEDITKDDYGKVMNEKEQKRAAEDLKKAFKKTPEKKIIYKDTIETLRSLENRKKEVMDLKIALEKKSALYKLLLDVKRNLLKIWGLIK